LNKPAALTGTLDHPLVIALFQRVWVPSFPDHPFDFRRGDAMLGNVVKVPLNPTKLLPAIHHFTREWPS